MAARIHLIEHFGHMKILDKDKFEWESGWWKISPDTADKLIDGEIYFHKAQAKPSFFGGLLLGYRVETEGEWVGRVVFRFRIGMEFKGIDAGVDGWGMEKKIVI